MSRTALSVFLALVCVTALVPSATFAKTDEVGASCTVSVTTSRGTVAFEGTKNEVMVWADETLNISWNGDNAVSAKDGLGKSIPVRGSVALKPPAAKKTYIYRFKGDEGKPATCAFTVYPIKGGINMYSLTSTSENPTISGTAMGLAQVVVVLKADVFSDEEVYRSKPITVKNGQWSVKIPEDLASGTYNVNLYAPQGIELGYIVSGTLTVSAGVAPSVSFTKASAPSNQTIAGGSSAPIAYVRLTNTSKGIATINGLYVKRTGTAKDSAVIGIGSKDDHGGSNGLNGGIDGFTPFNKKHLATIPFALTLNAGETRVITVTVGISKKLAPYNGKTLGLEIYGVSTGAKVTGTTVTSATLTLQ